jgi:hypothetical protein
MINNPTITIVDLDLGKVDASSQSQKKRQPLLRILADEDG